MIANRTVRFPRSVFGTGGFLCYNRSSPCMCRISAFPTVVCFGTVCHNTVMPVMGVIILPCSIPPVRMYFDWNGCSQVRGIIGMSISILSFCKNIQLICSICYSTRGYLESGASCGSITDFSICDYFIILIYQQTRGLTGIAIYLICRSMIYSHVLT